MDALTDDAESTASPADGAATRAADGVDPMLMQRARAVLDVPLAERAEAFDGLNRDVVAALRAIEES